MRLLGRKDYPPYEFQDLAVYNSERARGIVHTEEWDQRMAIQQRLFNEQQLRRWDAEGVIVIGR